MIQKPEAMDFSGKNIICIVSGLPGTGKTTLALSAPNVLLIDTDEGMARVNPAHRRDASICKTYEELLADVKAAEGQYQTVVIDTCGALIELMKDWAMRTDPKASKKDGGFSLQGYGVIKSEFLRLSAELRKKFNVVFVFHESMEKQDEGVFYQLVVEGSARTLVYQPADLAGHVFIDHGKRYIGFTPTENYSAKSAYGIKGIIEIPELKDGDANDFLTKLFAKVRANLSAEAKELAPQQDKYNEAMDLAKRACEAVNAPDDVPKALDFIKKIEHAMTSEKESKAMLKSRIAELGIVYDKENKVYVWKDKAD